MVKIALDAGAGELDFELVHGDDSEQIAAALMQLVERIGSFSVGDTITIREVE